MSEIAMIWTNQANILISATDEADGNIKIAFVENCKTEKSSITLTRWRAERLAKNILKFLESDKEPK